MRRLIMLVTLVLALVTPAAAVLPTPLSPQLLSSAVVYDADQLGFCGGTFIRVDVVLSAAHCVAGGKHIQVYDVRGKKYDVTSLLVSEPRDLSLLRLNTPSDVARPVTFADVAVGQEVWVIGAPAGEPFLVIHGYIAGFRTEAVSDGKPHLNQCNKKVETDMFGTTSQQYIVVDARAYFGDSGGGVFDTAGNLVGVTVRMAAVGNCEVRYPLWSLAVGPDAVATFLKDAGF